MTFFLIFNLIFIPAYLSWNLSDFIDFYDDY